MSKDSDSQCNQGPRGGMPKTLMEILAQEARGDRKLARIALGLAVVFHVFVFAITWPSFARSASKVEEQRTTVFVVQQVRFKPPPPRREQQIRRPRIHKVQIPDTTPQGPEPVREGPTTEDVDFVENPDLVLDVPEAPRPPEPEGPIVFEPGGNITEPIRVSGPNPVYPETALKVRFTGSVVLECMIGKDGAVKSVKVVTGQPLGLTESATEAVQKWRFQPSTLNGKPVEVIYILTVTFTLPQH